MRKENHTAVNTDDVNHESRKEERQRCRGNGTLVMVGGHARPWQRRCPMQNENEHRKRKFPSALQHLRASAVCLRGLVSATCANFMDKWRGVAASRARPLFLREYRSYGLCVNGLPAKSTRASRWHQSAPACLAGVWTLQKGGEAEPDARGGEWWHLLKGR